MLSTGLFVVHDALVSGQDDETELARGEHGGGEVLELLEGQVETGGDDAALVQATVQLDDDFATAVVINDFELVDVAVLLHAAEEFDEHLRDGAEEHLYIELMVRSRI